VFKKIIVPLDGSETAEAILPFVEEIARHNGAEIVLVTAVQQVGVWDAALTLQVLDREDASAAAYLGEQAKKLAGKQRSRVVRGDAAEAILRAADEESADLIAISTHGRSGVARWLFGSTATKLLEASTLPVLFLRPKSGEDKGAPGPVVHKILVPLDGSDTAMSILHTVEEFAKVMGASLVLFHSVMPTAAYPGFETQSSAAATVLDEMQAQARQILTRAMEDATKSRGVEATMLLALDTAVNGILRAADDQKVDLIAIGTHGHGGIGRAVLGSVADGVVRRSADVPCLVIRATEGAEILPGGSGPQP
jgi:nucleotide-binding universal stress UspA family protein